MSQISLELCVLASIIFTLLLYQQYSYDLASLLHHELTRRVKVPPSDQNAQTITDSDLIGVGLLPGPEDIAYDARSRLIYTGCDDGWIKQVTTNESVSDSVVSNWVNTGGRPMGLALGRNSDVYVADAYKGLLKIGGNGKVEQLTNKAEGLKFKCTDGIAVAKNGTIYFTDASFKYGLKDYLVDILEGEPHGRFMSYNPSNRRTQVLVNHLYFANGVAVSPQQDFVIFCETAKRRCRKYSLEGKREGKVDKFIDNLPGMPDNIKYDGEGHFWIAIAKPVTVRWNLALRFPLLGKILVVFWKYFQETQVEMDGGFVVVDLNGERIAYYHDFGLSLVSSGRKIQSYVYCGSYYYPYIVRLNVTRFVRHSSLSRKKY
ncbi:Strictosidine synthase [Bertholletia excelsa]